MSGPPPNEWTEINALVLQRLTRAMGPVDGRECLRAACAELGIEDVKSPTQLRVFAEHLIRRGGIFEAVGRGLKVSAILRGAPPS